MTLKQLGCTAQIKFTSLKSRSKSAALLFCCFCIWCAAPAMALASPIYSYKLFGEVYGHQDATDVLDGIELGTRFRADIRIDTSICTTDFVFTCENSVFTKIQIGNRKYATTGTFLTILKDPPLGVAVQYYGDDDLYLQSSVSVITPMYAGFQLLGDGILGDIGSQPINVRAFESGAFFYSFFYKPHDSQFSVGEVDLKIGIGRIISVSEPTSFVLLLLGFLGIYFRKKPSASKL